MTPSEIRQTAEFTAAQTLLEPYRNLPYKDNWETINAIMATLTEMCDRGWEACNCCPDGFNQIGFFTTSEFKFPYNAI
jgi:hypothetical protein